jgi:hypothetical protein
VENRCQQQNHWDTHAVAWLLEGFYLVWSQPRVDESEARKRQTRGQSSCDAPQIQWNVVSTAGSVADGREQCGDKSMIHQRPQSHAPARFTRLCSRACFPGVSATAQTCGACHGARKRATDQGQSSLALIHHGHRLALHSPPTSMQPSLAATNRQSKLADSGRHLAPCTPCKPTHKTVGKIQKFSNFPPKKVKNKK